MQYLAYITTFEGTGRPAETRVRAIEENQTLRDINPIAFQRGAVVVGRYPTEDEAWQAAKDYYDAHTVTEADGYVRWIMLAEPRSFESGE